MCDICDGDFVREYKCYDCGIDVCGDCIVLGTESEDEGSEYAQCRWCRGDEEDQDVGYWEASPEDIDEPAEDVDFSR